MKFWFCCTLLW